MTNNRSAGGRALYAWPDEVEAAVPEELSRGEAAIGRPVDVRVEVRTYAFMFGCGMVRAIVSVDADHTTLIHGVQTCVGRVAGGSGH